MDADAEILVRKKFDLLKPVFDEQVRRLWSAAEAQALGTSRDFCGCASNRPISHDNPSRCEGNRRITREEGFGEGPGAFVRLAEGGNRSASMTPHYARLLNGW